MENDDGEMISLSRDELSWLLLHVCKAESLAMLGEYSAHALREELVKAGVLRAGEGSQLSWFSWYFDRTLGRAIAGGSEFFGGFSRRRDLDPQIDPGAKVEDGTGTPPRFIPFLLKYLSEEGHGMLECMTEHYFSILEEYAFGESPLITRAREKGLKVPGTDGGR